MLELTQKGGNLCGYKIKIDGLKDKPFKRTLSLQTLAIDNAGKKTLDYHGINSLDQTEIEASPRSEFLCAELKNVELIIPEFDVKVMMDAGLINGRMISVSSESKSVSFTFNQAAYNKIAADNPNWKEEYDQYIKKSDKEISDRKDRKEKYEQAIKSAKFYSIFYCNDSAGAGREIGLAELLLKEAAASSEKGYPNPHIIPAMLRSYSQFCKSMSSLPVTKEESIQKLGDSVWEVENKKFYFFRLDGETIIGVMGIF